MQLCSFACCLATKVEGDEKTGAAQDLSPRDEDDDEEEFDTAEKGQPDVTAQKVATEALNNKAKQVIWKRRKTSVNFRSFMPERFEMDVGEHYTMDGKAFGEGGYGAVYLARDKAFKDRRVAIKKVTKTTKKLDDALRQEIATMKQLDHPNICRLLETFEVAQHIFFVMEFCEGGELFDRIIKEQKISEPTTAEIIRQVASALSYAHINKIAHRDLKPENICFASKDPSNQHAKVIDWGLSGIFEGRTMMAQLGSLQYASPEVLTEGCPYDCSCDLWSLGVVMYIMLCGRPPFWGSKNVLIKRVKAAEYPMKAAIWDPISPAAKDLVRRLLEPDVEKRLTAQGVLEHEWLQTTAPRTVSTASVAVLTNMRQFQGLSLFRSICIAAVARQLDYKALEEIHRVFAELDKDANGVLTVEEVKAGFGALFAGEDDKFVDEIFKSIDLDGSGTIDYTEFCTVALACQNEFQEEALWAAFRSFDKDGSGAISLKEMIDVVKSVDIQNSFTPEVCEEACREIMNRFDKDGNGYIDFEEWKVMMQRSTAGNPNMVDDPDEQPVLSLDKRELSQRLLEVGPEKPLEAYDILQTMNRKS